MSGPTLLDAVRACVAALAALEARLLLEPHALEVAIRERDDARAHVERLAHEVSASRRTIAGFATKVDDERLAHVKTRRLLAEASAEMERARDAATTAIRERMAAVDAQAAAEKRAAESMDKLAKQWTEAWTRAEAAEARAEVLEGDAVPFEWGIFSPDDRMQESFVTKGEADADLEYYPKKFFVSPLYRHPPRPAGKPAVWAIVFSDGMVNCYATELDARQSQSFGRGRLTPLYEAPPPAAIGVTDERFAVVGSDAPHGGNWTVWIDENHTVGSRADTRRAFERLYAAEGRTYSHVRLVDADAPTVNVAAIRKALKALRSVRIWTGGDLETGAAAFTAIEAAIGEKAVQPSGCVDHGPDGVGC